MFDKVQNVLYNDHGFKKPLKEPPLPIIYLAKKPLRFLVKTFLHMSIFVINISVNKLHVLTIIIYLLKVSL